MILQRHRIIVGEAGFEPGTSDSEVWRATKVATTYLCQAIYCTCSKAQKNIYFYKDFCSYLFTLFTFKKAGGEGQILFLKNSLTGSYIQYKNLQNPFFPVVLFKQRSVMLSFYESICYTVQNNLLFYIYTTLPARV